MHFKNIQFGQWFKEFCLSPGDYVLVKGEGADSDVDAFLCRVTPNRDPNSGGAYGEKSDEQERPRQPLRAIKIITDSGPVEEYGLDNLVTSNGQTVRQLGEFMRAVGATNESEMVANGVLAEEAALLQLRSQRLYSLSTLVEVLLRVPIEQVRAAWNVRTTIYPIEIEDIKSGIVGAREIIGRHEQDAARDHAAGVVGVVGKNKAGAIDRAGTTAGPGGCFPKDMMIPADADRDRRKVTHAEMESYLVDIFDRHQKKLRGERKNAQQSGDDAMPYVTLGATNSYDKGSTISRATKKSPLLAFKVNRYFRDHFVLGTATQSGIVFPGKLSDRKATSTAAPSGGPAASSSAAKVGALSGGAPFSSTKAEILANGTGSLEDLPFFVYSTVTVNDTYQTKLHCDAGNLGPSALLTLGEFTGGETWVYDDSLEAGDAGACEIELVDAAEQKCIRNYRKQVGSVRTDHTKAVGQLLSSNRQFVL